LLEEKTSFIFGLTLTSAVAIEEGWLNISIKSCVPALPDGLGYYKGIAKNSSADCNFICAIVSVLNSSNKKLVF